MVPKPRSKSLTNIKFWYWKTCHLIITNWQCFFLILGRNFFSTQKFPSWACGWKMECGRKVGVDLFPSFSQLLVLSTRASWAARLKALTCPNGSAAGWRLEGDAWMCGCFYEYAIVWLWRSVRHVSKEGMEKGGVWCWVGVCRWSCISSFWGITQILLVPIELKTEWSPSPTICLTCVVHDFKLEVQRLSSSPSTQDWWQTEESIVCNLRKASDGEAISKSNKRKPATWAELPKWHKSTRSYPSTTPRSRIIAHCPYNHHTKLYLGILK